MLQGNIREPKAYILEGSFPEREGDNPPGIQKLDNTSSDPFTNRLYLLAWIAKQLD
jgi:hypothetical protein